MITLHRQLKLFLEWLTIVEFLDWNSSEEGNFESTLTRSSGDFSNDVCWKMRLISSTNVLYDKLTMFISVTQLQKSICLVIVEQRMKYLSSEGFLLSQSTKNQK